MPLIMGRDWLADKLVNWWCDSVWWIRVGVGLLLFLYGMYSVVSLWLDPTSGSIVAGRGFAGSVLIMGFGLILMVAGGKSQSERNGYRF